MTQYDVELVQRLEEVIKTKLELWPTERDEVVLLKERVDEAGRLAASELRDQSQNSKGGGGGRKRRKEEGASRDDRDRDDDEVEAGMPTKKKSKNRR